MYYKLHSHKVEHTFIEAVCLGILANLMVCLAVWMSYAGRTLIDKLFLHLFLPIGMFLWRVALSTVSLTCFLFTLGIVIKNFAPAEFWTTVGASPEQFFKSNSIKFPR